MTEIFKIKRALASTLMAVAATIFVSTALLVTYGVLRRALETTSIFDKHSDVIFAASIIIISAQIILLALAVVVLSKFRNIIVGPEKRDRMYLLIFAALLLSAALIVSIQESLSMAMELSNFVFRDGMGEVSKLFLIITCGLTVVIFWTIIVMVRHYPSKSVNSGENG